MALQRVRSFQVNMIPGGVGVYFYLAAGPVSGCCSGAIQGSGSSSLHLICPRIGKGVATDTALGIYLQPVSGSGIQPRKGKGRIGHGSHIRLYPLPARSRLVARHIFIKGTTNRLHPADANAGRSRRAHGDRIGSGAILAGSHLNARGPKSGIFSRPPARNTTK